MKMRPSHALLTAFFLGSGSLGFAQSTWDFGANPDQNWSTATNWSTDTSPAGTAVIFGALGTTGNSTAIGNIVDQNFSISTLTYNQTGTSAWQVTQLASGQTLTVGGNVRVGTTQATTGLSTLTALTGGGNLVVNDTASTFAVTSNVSTGSNSASRATFDLSALGSFNATVSAFNIGSGNTGYGTLFLSDSSTITATTFTTGGSGDYNSNSTTSNRLYLGNSTTLNASTIALASGRTPGLVQFRPASLGANPAAATGGTLTVRGTAGGTTRAAITIGDLGGGTSSQNGSSLVDLTGGSVDILASTLKVGRSDATLNGNYNATLSMAAGSIDATDVTLGEVANTNAGTGTINGTINVSGGTFTAGTMILGSNTTSGSRAASGTLNVSSTGSVHVTGNLTMGRRNASTSITSVVTVSGGTLLVEGNIAEGTGAGANITSTINLSGGLLDMDHGSIAVDTLNFTGGTLKDASAFTGALSLQNSSALAFDVDNEFSTLSLSGSFTLSGSSNLVLTLANGFTPVGDLLLVSNDGGDSISGLFGSVNGASYTPGDQFFLSNNTGTYGYTLSYTGGDGNDLVALMAVPEPSTYLLLGLGLMSLYAFRRRQARA